MRAYAPTVFRYQYEYPCHMSNQSVASSRTLPLKPMLHARYSALYYMPSSLKGWPGANARYTAATDRPRRSDVLNSPALALRGSS